MLLPRYSPIASTKLLHLFLVFSLKLIKECSLRPVKVLIFLAFSACIWPFQLNESKLWILPFHFIWLLIVRLSTTLYHNLVLIIKFSQQLSLDHWIQFFQRILLIIPNKFFSQIHIKCGFIVCDGSFINITNGLHPFYKEWRLKFSQYALNIQLPCPPPKRTSLKLYIFYDWAI